MLPSEELNYLNLMRKILAEGEHRENRTGIKTFSIFAPEPLKFNVGQSFPLLRTKRIHWRSVITELCWFLRGGTNIKWLQQHGCTIWDEWADAEGYLGPVYGKQWRAWYNGEDHFDQVIGLVKSILADPYSRRHIINAWNVGDLEDMALQPCHVMSQFNVRPSPDTVGVWIVDCQMTQRSADMFLGVPFNIASYAALMHVICAMAYYHSNAEYAYIPGQLTCVYGDAHVYENHLAQAQEQIRRGEELTTNVRSSSRVRCLVDKGAWLDDFALSIAPNNILIADYDPMPAIKAPVAV